MSLDPGDPGSILGVSWDFFIKWIICLSTSLTSTFLCDGNSNYNLVVSGRKCEIGDGTIYWGNEETTVI